MTAETRGTEDTNRAGHTISGPGKALFRLVTGTHAAVYRRTRGRVAGRMGRTPMLLLTTTGRKSGRERVTPLLYLEDGGRLVVVASAGGAAQHPGWWHNLRASPEASVQLGERTLRVRAEVAGPEERARLWPRLVAMFPRFGEYQRATSRQIPVVILHPLEGALAA